MTTLADMNLSELLDLVRLECTRTDDWDNPDYLADLLVRLASYYSTLGQFLADAEYEADEAEITYKVKREHSTVEVINEGGSAAKGAAMAVGESEAERRLHAKLQHKARLLYLSRQSLERTMDSLRSKLSYLKRTMEDSRF